MPTLTVQPELMGSSKTGSLTLQPMSEEGGGGHILPNIRTNFIQFQALAIATFSSLGYCNIFKNVFKNIKTLPN